MPHKAAKHNHNLYAPLNLCKYKQTEHDEVKRACTNFNFEFTTLKPPSNPSNPKHQKQLMNRNFSVEIILKTAKLSNLHFNSIQEIEIQIV